MNCPYCQHSNPQRANFCLHCGWRLAACPSCGDERSSGLTCVRCGWLPKMGPGLLALERDSTAPSRTKASARVGERKQVTVLFADTVRSTALVAKLGPEAFRELMNELFALARTEVEGFGGTINQLLGDGFMALFGALVAQEDHTRRAVLAADRLRTRVRHLLRSRGIELRVGIASGLAVVDTIGDDAAGTITAFGEVTVLAARLQALAEPGAILLTTFEADRVRGIADLVPAGDLLLGGTAVRVESLRAADGRRAPSREGGRVLAPFVGRGSELGELLRLLPELHAGRGQAVHIVGDPGVGKSRLVLEFSHASGLRVIEARCVSYGSAMPYVPISDFVRQACVVGPDDAATTVASKVRDELARVGLGEPAIGPLLDLAGQRHDGEDLSRLDPATVKRRTFDTLLEFCRAESRVDPFVIVVEDLHWIDRTSEEFLASLVDDLAGHPLLLVMTQRLGYEAPWRANAGVTLLKLHSLHDDSSRAIVHAASPEPLEPSRLEAIVARGEGNPFFLEELARAWVHDGFQDVPDTVQDVLAARLHRLGDAPKQLAQTASVLGRDFSLRLLRAVWSQRAGLGPLLRQLEELGVLSAGRGSGAGECRFKHALTHDVAYGSLLDRQRRQLHGNAGAALERLHMDELAEHCELIAYHYARSNDQRKAVDFLVMANRRAASRNAMEEAVGYFYQALHALEKLDDSDATRRERVQLVFAQTGEFHFLHRHQEYYDLIVAQEPLVRALGDEGLHAAFDARLGHRQWTSGAVALSIETLNRAAATCARCGSDEHGASTQSILAWANLLQGNYAEVPRARDRALEILERRFDPVWYSFACAAAIMGCSWTGRWSDAVREGMKAVSEARAREDRAIVSFSTSWIAYAYLLQGDWESARDHSLIALEQAPTVYFRGFPQAMLARALCALGKAGEGVAILSQVEPLVRASGHRPAWALIAGLLGEAYLAVGDVQSARATFEAVNSAACAGPMSFMRVRSSRLLGQIALEDGQLGDARRWLADAMHEGRRSGALNEIALTLAAQGRLARINGNSAGARAQLEEARLMLHSLATLDEPQRLSQELDALAD